MKNTQAKITKFLTWSARNAGHPLAFVIALTGVTIWFLIGLSVGFSTRWILIIDTIATINASLMVFIIQNTQNRESKALHLKLDELISVSKEAERELIAIEQMEEEELENIRKKIQQKRSAKEKNDKRG